VCRKVTGETTLSGNLMDFLRYRMNKRELFAFLTSKVAEFNWSPAKAVRYIQWCSGGGTRGKAVPPNILLEERCSPAYYQDMGER